MCQTALQTWKGAEWNFMRSSEILGLYLERFLRYRPLKFENWAKRVKLCFERNILNMIVDGMTWEDDLRGWLERMTWEDDLRGWLDRMILEDDLRGWLERVTWEDYMRGWLERMTWENDLRGWLDRMTWEDDLRDDLRGWLERMTLGCEFWSLGPKLWLNLAEKSNQN